MVILKALMMKFCFKLADGTYWLQDEYKILVSLCLLSEGQYLGSQ